MTRTRKPTRRTLPGLLALAMSATITASSSAHLSLIRLGKESAGVREANASFGAALAAGDFNNDGFEDLATGAPTHVQDSGLPAATVGAVVVNLGSTYGLTHEGALALLFSSTDTNQRFGAALAAGDFDANGFVDLAVGAPDRDEASAVDAGQVYIYEGAGVGIEVLPSLNLSATALMLAPATGDGFGTALAAGSFNDDAFADLAIGIPGKNGGEGMVVVLYGSAAGLDTSAPDVFTPVSLGVSDPTGAFGFALATGDQVGDANDDLAIGAPGGMVMGVSGAGRVYVIHGSPTGLLPIFPLFLDADHFGLAPTPDAELGAALAVGNFYDAGGKSDLAIGSPGFDADAGRVLVTHPNTLQDGADQFFVFDKEDAGSANAPDTRFGQTLAAGDRDHDGDDELAVGSPKQTAGGQEDAGYVNLFERDDTDILDMNHGLWARRLNAEAQENGNFGAAVCFGAFDGTGKGNVAVGSPGADYKRWKAMGQLGFSTLPASGQVHVYAPWRQTLSMEGKSGATLNCNDELVFSQRPFDEVAIASTTKAMTLLLAAEDLENEVVDELDTISITGDKTWVVDCPIGSGTVLNAGETITLESLMELSLCISSGQCTYLIASLLTNGVDPFPAGCPSPDDSEPFCDPSFPIVQPTFVARMNQKASDLGLLDTHFTNPHGSRSGSCLGGERHHSTAYDMALLSSAVMANEYLRDFLDQVTLTIELENGTAECKYDFLESLKSQTDSLAIGIKPGGSGYAGETGIAALRSLTSMVSPVVATYFGGDEDALVEARLSHMMLDANGLCAGPGPGEVLPPIDPDPSGPFVVAQGIPAESGSSPYHGLVELPTNGDATLEIDVHRFGVPPADSTEFRLCFGLASERELGPGETATFGVAPFDAHEGFHIQQMSGRSAMYQLTISDPPSSETIVLLPGETVDVPAHSAPGSAGFTLSLQNLSSVNASSFLVNEASYSFDVSLATGSGGGSNAFHATLQQSQAQSPNANILSWKLDEFVGAPGEQLVFFAHPPGLVVGVEEEALVVAPPALRVRQFPNPVRASATIEYTLSGASQLEITVFDAQGRAVRLLDRDLARSPGTHRVEWDGRDEAGSHVASGVYWWRVQATEGTAIGRMVLVR